MMLCIYSSVDLSRYTTLCTPALARRFTKIDSFDNLKEAVTYAREHKLELLALGSGSNILFQNDYEEGLILYNELKGKTVVEENNDYVIIDVNSGENWHDLVKWCLKQKWYGLENLALIPGTVGAAPIQNIGAYGVELVDIF